MTSKYPEIRIKDAWLLRQNTAEPLQRYWAPDKTTRSAEEIAGIVEKYKEFWQPYEKKVLKAMHDVMGLEYRANIIDVYVAPWFYAFSDPLVIGVVFDTQRKLVETLTHELLHRYLSDNRTTDDTKTIETYERYFGKHEFVTLVHIPVFAMLHAIFIDELNEPEFLSEEKLGTKDYKDAWEYVQEHGYEEVISQLKKMHANELLDKHDK